MLAVNIPASEIKDFMNKLLRGDAFDKLELRNVLINSFVQFDINGLVDPAHMTEEERGNNVKRYILWEELRPYIFNIIKGNKRPKTMKFVFSLPKKNVEELTKGASALFLNIIFDNGEVTIISGVSEKTFSLDKSIEYMWDEYIKDFFKTKNIAVAEN